ncbi:MAG: thiamine-phosphate pyrophosphorylase [Candidatus Omnitrophica bacterium]|nr:thiamine-phosphate pyrophosphorylase [Candidatus Omnitrophota bacterium]
MNKTQLFRILDANFNRSREGLRVCEEIARFVMGEGVLSREFKRLRHAIGRVLTEGPSLSLRELLSARDAEGDVGKGFSVLERKRAGFPDLFLANVQRAKESLRVLEETSKCVEPRASEKLKRIRFRVYALEKKTLPKLEALCDH